MSKAKRGRKTNIQDMDSGQILLYQSKDGKNQVEVRLREGTIWLTLNQLADLFDRDKSVIFRHLRNIFNSGDLDREATAAKNAQVAKDGKIRQMDSRVRLGEAYGI